MAIALFKSKLGILAMLIWVGIIFFRALTWFSAPALAQVNCKNLPHWSSTTPSVNQTHIFCGEWSDSRPKGFHSRPGQLNPSTVASFAIANPPNSQGIYDGRWAYVGHPTPTKFSTMFPDNCPRDRVLNSIVYAATHPISCPRGAPTWAKCGPNKPTSGTGHYCQAADGTIFAIAFATVGNGKVNTAFPLR